MPEVEQLDVNLLGWIQNKVKLSAALIKNGTDTGYKSLYEV